MGCRGSPKRTPTLHLRGDISKRCIIWDFLVGTWPHAGPAVHQPAMYNWRRYMYINFGMWRSWSENCQGQFAREYSDQSYAFNHEIPGAIRN